MKVLSKSLLTIITAIALFMLPIFFSGCDAAKNASYNEYLYDAANNFFGNRIDVENYASTTYKFNKTDKTTEKVEVAYKASPTATELTTGTFTNKRDVTEDAQIALQKTQDGFVAYFEGNRTTVEEINQAKATDDTLETKTTTTVQSDKYYFTKVGTEFYVVRIASQTVNNGDPATLKEKMNFATEATFVSAMNQVIKKMNIFTMQTFFTWQQMMVFYGNILEAQLDGDNLTAKLAENAVSLDDYEAMLIDVDAQFVYNNKLPVKLTEKANSQTQVVTEDVDLGVEIINSASITIPADLMTDAAAGDIDYLEFVDNLPTFSLAD